MIDKNIEDISETSDIVIAGRKYIELLYIIESEIAQIKKTKAVERLAADIDLSNGNSTLNNGNFALNKMCCIMLKTLTGGDINKKGTEEIMSKQQDYYLTYIDEVQRCIEGATKDYSNLMKSQKETLEKMQELCNQSEKIGLEPDEPILKEEILLPYQTAIRSIHELATAMLLLEEKQEDEFVRECLPQELFLTTIESIIGRTMCGDIEEKEVVEIRAEILKGCVQQLLNPEEMSLEQREKLKENASKIKMLVSPENTGK